MSAPAIPFSLKEKMGLFKKKKKEVAQKKKMDFSGYDMVLSIKSICMYERLSGESFFNFDEEGMGMLLYCTFYITNNVEIKYDTFLNMLEVEEIALWMAEKYKDILDVIQQFKSIEPENEEKPQGEAMNLTMTDMATSLIVDYHLDAHYVMYEMKLWEIEPMYRACDSMVKRRYDEERFWAYIGILPHVDGKKLKGPSDLIPFPWDKDSKEETMKKLNRDTAAAVAFLGGKKDGER